MHLKNEVMSWHKVLSKDQREVCDNTIEAFQYHWAPIMLTAYGIGVCRAFLEFYIYKDYPPFMHEIFGLHYPLSFIEIAMMVSIPLSYIAGYKYDKTFKVALSMLVIILLPPVIDAFVYGIGSRKILYLPFTNNQLEQFIDAVFRRKYCDYISVGQLVVVHSIALFASIFTWFATKGVMRSVLSWIFVLIIIYFYAVLPSLLLEISSDINNTIRSYIGIEQISGTVSFGIFDTPQKFEVAFTLIVLPALALLALYIQTPSMFKIIIRSMRSFRLFHYVGMFVLGIIISAKEMGGIDMLLGSPYNLIAIIVMMQGVGSAFCCAVWVNNLYDCAIDKHHKNHQNAIAKGEVSTKLAIGISLSYGIFAMLCATTVGEHMLILVMVMLAMQFIYSAPPLRIRRYFPASLLTIGVINVLVVQAGYILLLGNNLILMPIRFILGIGLGLSLIASFKDVKDRYGDGINSIKTLMTLFSEKTGRILTAFFVCLGTLVLVFTFHSQMRAIVLGAVLGLLGLGVSFKYTEKEKILFAVYYSGIGMTILFYCLS